jgi:hypothetical protein
MNVANAPGKLLQYLIMCCIVTKPDRYEMKARHTFFHAPE